MLRPCGGVACQLAGNDTAEATRSFLADGRVPVAEISNSPLGVIIRRGKLPGAGEWTHALTDAHRRAMATLVPDNPRQADSGRIVWEYLGLVGDYLLGTLGHEGDEGSKGLPFTKTIQQSKVIFVISRTTGELLWEHQLERSVSPTAIVADAQTVYLLDRTGGAMYEQSLRRGTGAEPVSQLKALDLATGTIRWEQGDIPSSWKTLMLSDGVLVAYPYPAENAARDGDKGVGVYTCRDGKPIWSRQKLPGISETGRGGTMRHSFIVGDTLFLPWAYDLRTGEEQLLEQDPLTGQPKRFDVSGKNFCGTITAAKELLIYRSASMGFAPISRDSGSYWLPESRPSCWISAIPAGGMVLAPEGYSTCICPYNYKTSLALIPVERNENWSVYLAGGRREKMAAKEARNKARKKGKKISPSQGKPEIETVRTLHINLNAPGDQMDAEGKLWLAWPRPKDPKKVYLIRQIPVQVETEKKGFRFNSDYYPIANTKTPWLYTSGLTGPLKINVRLSGGQPGYYRVALHFTETENTTPGERVFDVKIQGENAISRLDIIVETGAANRALVKEFSNIKANGMMSIELIPVVGSDPLICSLEIVEQ